jgi:peptide/nickel transport system permease protein
MTAIVSPMRATPDTAESAAAFGRRPASRRWRTVRRWLRQERSGVAAGSFLAIIAIAAVFAPIVAPADPLDQDIPNKLAGMSAANWLGTDDLGRDVLSRLIFGARASLLASGFAVLVAIVIGLPLGLLAGYVGGWVDRVLMKVADTVLAFPALVLAIGVTGALGPGLMTSMGAMGVVFSPSVARLMRSQTLVVRQEPFVAASEMFGSRPSAIIVRHIIPNAIQPVLVQTSLLLAGALLAEASLSFLGLGVQAPTPSWGSMLGRAYTAMNKAPAQMLSPGITIALCALSFNIIGDALRRQLDPRQRR